MKTEMYIEKLKHLKKKDAQEVFDLLNEAAYDSDISNDDLTTLNDIADDIYYERNTVNLQEGKEG